MAERLKNERKKRSTPRPRAQEQPKLSPPTSEAVLAAAFELSRQLSLEAREDELVGVFAATLGSLLPGRHLCLRVVDPKTHELSSMVIAGPNANTKRALGEEPLAVKRSALARTHLGEEVTRSPRLRLIDGYEPVFQETGGGFSVPLVASGELFGLLNVEYPLAGPPAPPSSPGGSAPDKLGAADEPLVIPLANQLSVALRNLTLLGEARYYRDYLRKMIDGANALIVVVDRAATVAVMNRAMQTYLGVSGDVLGCPIRALPPALGTLLMPGLKGTTYTDCEIELPRQAEGPGRALFNTSVLRANDGSIDGVIGIGSDIERVRSLERQVIQAEKLATLGQLAAGVVHELNNPLTSISVYADYLVRLVEKLGDKTDVEKARRVVDGAVRIQKLTRDLMSYARPSGEYERVSINDVVRQAFVFCEHIVRRAEADVSLLLGDELPLVHGIRTQLHQVLINLITNAVHALPKKGGCVSLYTELVPGGSSVEVRVSDNGVGIDRLDQARVFEPFFSTKKESKGTGLGLSIVKNIIEGHGGSVRFESTPGAGTTFFITLPILKMSE